MNDMDELGEIKEMLRSAVGQLDSLGAELKQEARSATEKAADYEERKNGFLTQLFDEEAQKGFKRTESQRQALYRAAYREERREAMIAKEQLQSSRDLYRGLQAKVNAIQTLARIVEAEMRL